MVPNCPTVPVDWDALLEGLPLTEVVSDKAFPTQATPTPASDGPSSGSSSSTTASTS